MKRKVRLSPEVAALGKAVMDLRSRIAKLEKVVKSAKVEPTRRVGFQFEGPDTIQGEVVPQMEDFE